MTNKTYFKKNNEFIILAIFYFISILAVLLIFRDFGVHIEERFHRMNGLYWLNYISEVFEFKKLYLITNSKMSVVDDFTLSSVSHYNKYGAIFDVPMALIEIMFGMEKTKNIYHVKHFFSFLVFLTSSFFFYKILNKRFKNFYLCFAGTILFLTTPRIFGDSFLYKDVLFLSFFNISLYFLLELLENLDIKKIIYFSIFCAIAFNLRIFVLFLPITFFLILLIKSFYTKKIITYIKFYLFYLFLFICLIIFFSPYLWSNPFANFLEIFYSLKRDLIGANIKVLFNNEFINNRNVPETYLLTWIFISTPIITIIIFSLGYFFYFFRLIKRFVRIEEKSNFNDLWRSNKEQKDFTIFLILTSFYFSLLIFNSPFYNGWRLVYFLNIFIIYFFIYQIDILMIFYKKNHLKKKFVSSLIIASVIYNIFCLIKYHPFQSYYFTEVIGQDMKNSFEGDYYGLSGKDFFLRLNSEYKGSTIKIAVASHTPLYRALDSIDENKRKKFKVIGQDYKNADFIYKNNNSEVNSNLNKKYNIPNNFDKIYELKINGIKLYEIYKNKNIK